MTKTRELALKGILEAQSWLDKVKDDTTLNYLRLARERLTIDDVVEEAESLGLSTKWKSCGSERLLPCSMIRSMVEERKKYNTLDEYRRAQVRAINATGRGEERCKP